MTRPILAPRHAEVLDRLAAQRVLLVFDLDGTLAPITARPGDAALRPRTRDLLRAVAAHYPTAVLTGRDRADAAARLRGIPLVAIVGNHGLDRSTRFLGAMARTWARRLRQLLRDEPGVTVEAKRHSVSVHYRAARDRARARRRIMRAVAPLSPAPRVLPGKAVVNLVPDVGLDKGTALEDLMRAHRADAAIVLGDDHTDEDAFRLAGRHAGVVTIRVGRSRRSSAAYAIPSQRQIDALLARLLAARGSATNSRESRNKAAERKT